MKLFYHTLLLAVMLFGAHVLNAQCSICSKTAQQLGDGPASGLNTGIMYLAFVPLAMFGYFGYRWWKNEKLNNNN